MKVTIEAPNGEDITYVLPAIRLRSYNLDSIFEKDLYILIPFYLFNLEESFGKISDGDETAVNELRDQISGLYERLKKRKEDGMIDEYTRRSLIDLSKKVMTALTKNYRVVYREVNRIMGGRVLDYEAKSILNRGVRQGLREAERSVIEKICRRGGTVEEAVELTDAYTKDEIQEIFNSLTK